MTCPFSRLQTTNSRHWAVNVQIECNDSCTYARRTQREVRGIEVATSLVRVGRMSLSLSGRCRVELEASRREKDEWDAEGVHNVADQVTARLATLTVRSRLLTARISTGGLLYASTYQVVEPTSLYMVVQRASRRACVRCVAARIVHVRSNRTRKCLTREHQASDEFRRSRISMYSVCHAPE